ncbi:hypothetical protein R6Q59_016333 [Mikania micrantha]|uniref:C3H1-type domain-containing protein n=1 Tax=Mikania micrantha TaxID=192012 RepID=A0A5N6PJL8_9ASTR|nr:hypothetical protein E3N88_09323 [Mikania micrantha]
MDEDELNKRFTDCVYFLASPLTCKKGIECVYRHSEIARLNPRDCWYWLSGCCYNPDCAFRHPPLEGLKEAYHESLNPNNGPTLPVFDKTNAPCYFYSKGFCNKAERCLFLHDPPDSNKSMVTNGVFCEKKFTAGNNTSLTPVQIVHTHPDQPDAVQTEPTHTVVKHTPDSHQLASRTESVENVEEEFVESEENVAESEEIIVQSGSDGYNDQSSDGYIEREKWLDLPPGFDLVEGESERLEYEVNDVDFCSVNDEENMELDFRYSEYDRYDKISGQPRVSIFNRLSFKKINPYKKLIFNVQRGSDLRDHLKKSKVVDVDRRNFRSYTSHGEVDFDPRVWFRKAVPVNRYRPTLKKPRFLSSRFRKPAQQRKGESQEESMVFTGPKTLDQIKQEKTKARENRGFGSNNRTEPDGLFQGPRPLSEILENKRKVG